MGISQLSTVQEDLNETALVSLAASANLPSEYGDFRIFGFLEHATGKEHTAIVRGDVRGQKDVVCRIHSECHTGDVLGSLRCDCRDQLLYALEYIGKQKHGVVVYMKQEGRGIGLINKIKAYHLQDLGLDTVEANEALGFPAEGRSYEIAAEILSLLEIHSIKLMSNNPEKFNGLKEFGVSISDRVPVIMSPNSHNAHYLSTKEEKMGHVFDTSVIDT